MIVSIFILNIEKQKNVSAEVFKNFS